MSESFTTDQAPRGVLEEARAGERSHVGHLHLDRRARVWRTHAELERDATYNLLGSAQQLEGAAR